MKQKRGRKRGATLRPNDVRPAAKRRMDRLVADTHQVMIGCTEIEAHASRRADWISKALSVDNLKQDGKVTWTTSCFNVPLWYHMPTQSFEHAASTPRELMPPHVVPVMTEAEWNEGAERRKHLALERQKSAGRKQGHHGRKGGRPRGSFGTDVSSGQ